MANLYVQAIALRDERFYVLGPYFRDVRVHELQDILASGKFFELIAKEDRLLMYVFLSTQVFPDGTPGLTCVPTTVSEVSSSSAQRKPHPLTPAPVATAAPAPVATAAPAPVATAAPAPAAAPSTSTSAPPSPAAPMAKNTPSKAVTPTQKENESWTQVTRRKNARRLVVIGSEQDNG